MADYVVVNTCVLFPCYAGERLVYCNVAYSDRLHRREILDVASLVIGIIAAMVGFIPCVNVFVILPAIAGLILGIIAFKKKKEEELPSGVALAGIILNSLPLLVMTIYLVLAIVSGEVNSINEMTIR